MRSIFEKKAMSSVFMQMFIIVMTFAIMCISTYFIVSNIEHKHLLHDAEQALDLTEGEINAGLLENETFISNFSETIHKMIIKDVGENMVFDYIKDMANFIINDNAHMRDLIDVYGYFHKWDGKFISINNYRGEDFNTLDQDCYIAAIEAEGNITVTDPLYNPDTKRTSITFSRCLTDDNSIPLAVICTDVDINRVMNSAIDICLTDNSYGFLLNRDLIIFAHPQSYLINSYLYNVNSDISAVAAELQAGMEVRERRIKNYKNEDSILYFKKIKYDWYLGIVIPVHEYYKNTYFLTFFLTALGSILALLLCIMLYQISKAKMRSDIRTQQKSNFLATMSHEIRTPLNAILGMTEIQMLDSAHPPATSVAFLKINNSGNLLLNIVNDILDLSKIEAGKLELVPVKYEVASMINDTVQLNYIRYENKPIEFTLEVDENIPSILVGDELRIKQILNNILSNAFKYTDKGKVELSINAECVTRVGSVFVTLIFEVKDTGQGMTSQQVSKLFDEYTRFNMEANRTTEGAGLGMTITRNLVELMYGKILVKSKVGEGTTVTVRLPQKTDGIGISSILGKDTVDSLRQFRLGNNINLKKSHINHEYMPYGHVLIVDDVDTNLYVAKGLMIPYGLNIDVVSSGFEAIEKINSGEKYDIVFMDHMMPKMDGIETTKRLRDSGYTSPIVALTANALAGQAEIFLKSGFDAFISKPIDVRQLNVTLNRLIRDKQPPEVIEAAQKEKAKFDQKQAASDEKQQIDSQLAEIFARDAEKAVKTLEALFERNFRTESDIQSYVINVHAMKSALANIGEKALSAVALRLEQAGREKDTNVMMSETRDFINELNKVIENIKPKEEDDIVDTEESLSELSEKLAVIKEACGSFDKKTVKNTLKDLREKTWSHKVKDTLNEMSEHLLHSDFDKTAALADEFINKK